jgi:hypothetical protein
MQYLLLIYEDEKRWANPSKAEFDAEMAGYHTFGKDFSSSIKGGNALQPTGTAKTVRVRDGKAMVTDGPFAETKEQLGGYYLVEAENQEQALGMAGKIPGARAGCVEVRPIMVFS